MKKNKIVNKIGILVLAVMLSILSSITVLASEPEYSGSVVKTKI